MQSQRQKWEDSSIVDYSTRTDPSNQPKITNEGDNGRFQNWDPKAMLNNLSFMEQKVHQLQELVHMIMGQNNGVATQQKQLITAELTSIIIQLISTAGSLLPSVNPPPMQLNGLLFPSPINSVQQQNVGDSTTFDQMPKKLDVMEEDNESKEEDEGKEEEHLPPGSYEILQLEKEEILAPHTHFCTICGKGFKRDANLRMHMRGHGDEYKTAAALAKPNKESSSERVILKRYSCPSIGCKRNKDHKKFQPLKTILCVKNHYKRTHCDKSYTCSRCLTKKFSVLADLKTHEKHCGRDKWLCSCGTTFSRKDKLFGHITLFQGHTPAIPTDDIKASTNFGSNSVNGNDIQEPTPIGEDPYLSMLSYECSLSDLQDFPATNYDDSSSSFAFLISEEKFEVQSGTTDID